MAGNLQGVPSVWDVTPRLHAPGVTQKGITVSSQNGQPQANTIFAVQFENPNNRFINSRLEQCARGFGRAGI